MTHVKNDFYQTLSKVKHFSFSFPEQPDIQYLAILRRRLQLQEYSPSSLLKKKKPCANRRAFQISIFLRLRTAYTWLLACLENHRRLCRAPLFQVRHTALKRLTDTQLACSLDWQGLIALNLLDYSQIVKIKAQEIK